MSDAPGSDDLLDSDNTGIRARAVRVLGERTSQPGALKRLLERLEAESDPRVLSELGRALRKHLSSATADSIIGSIWVARRNATGPRRDAADTMLREMGGALGWSHEQVDGAGHQWAERDAARNRGDVPEAGAQEPPGASPAPATARPIALSGGHRVPRQGSSPGAAAALSALLDPVDRAREHLDLGQSAEAIAVLQDAVRTQHERARLAAAWLGAVLLATGQRALAAEHLALASQDPRPPHADLERVRAYCRAHGLVPLPAALREVRPAANPPPAGATRDGVDAARAHLPARFGRVELIGAGGMGIVFRAHDAKLGRDVAIKMVAPDSWTDEHALKRFDAEARALARLTHPAVLRIHEIHSGAVPFFTMELLEGTPIDELLAGGLPPVPVVVRHLVTVLEALDHCHEAGIVHRDVKPRNIFVTSAGEVRLMDFGVVKSAGATSMTKLGMIVGTPNYMSPEQLLATRVDRRADIYAFGVTLFQMLTGVLPYRDPGEVLARPAPSVRDWVDVPAELAAIVDRCLKRSPDNRYQTCRELIAELAPFTASAKPAGPSVRDVFTAVVYECLRDRERAGQANELVVLVRRVLGISAEVHQEVFRGAEERMRAASGSGRGIASEELFRLVVRCRFEEIGQSPDAEPMLDELGRLLEIPRPRRRQIELELAEKLARS